MADNDTPQQPQPPRNPYQPQPPYGQPGPGQPQFGQPQFGQPPPQYGPYAPSQPMQGASTLTASPPPKKNRTLLILLVVGAVVLLGLIGGCAALLGSAAKTASDAIPSTVPGSTAPSATAASEPSDEPTDEPTDEPSDEPTSDEAGIKDTFTWEDGVQAKISKVQHRKISEYAAGGRPGEQMVILTLKVTNESGQNLDGDEFQIEVSYGSDGEPADKVYDSGVKDGISGTIGKKRSKSGEYAFAIPSKGQQDVIVEVTPGYEYSSGRFAGSVR